MYNLSNKDREDIIKLLVALQNLQGIDVKTANTKRRASILARKLSRIKPCQH